MAPPNVILNIGTPGATKAAYLFACHASAHTKFSDWLQFSLSIKSGAKKVCVAVAVSIIIFELQSSVSLELAMPTPCHCLAIAVPLLYCYISF